MRDSGRGIVRDSGRGIVRDTGRREDCDLNGKRKSKDCKLLTKLFFFS